MKINKKVKKDKKQPQMINNYKGVTLVAIIITIVIMLILVAVGVNFIIDGKIFDQTEKTVEATNDKVADEQDRVDSLTDELDDALGDIEDGDTSSGGTGDTGGTGETDTTPPTVVVTVGTVTTNSIEVSVSANDGESGLVTTPTYTYYIKENGASNYIQKAANRTERYTFEELTDGKTYDIRVTVNGDNAGNIGAGTTQATTGTVTSAVETGAITFGSVTWTSGKASITVSTNTSYSIEYQKNGVTEGFWTTIANGGAITDLKHGDTVYARLTDGNNSGDYTSVSIADGTAPTISNFSVVSADTESITVSVTATDADSGIYSYAFRLNKSTVATITVSGGTYTYIYRGLSDNTNYFLEIIATNNAGLTSIEDIEGAGTECIHTYGDWVVTTAATCSTLGVQTQTCSKCKATQTQNIPVIEHTFTTKTQTAASSFCSTCGNGISKDHVCDVCGGAMPCAINCEDTCPGGRWCTSLHSTDHTGNYCA